MLPENKNDYLAMKHNEYKLSDLIILAKKR